MATKMSARISSQSGNQAVSCSVNGRSGLKAKGPELVDAWGDCARSTNRTPPAQGTQAQPPVLRVLRAPYVASRALPSEAQKERTEVMEQWMLGWTVPAVVAPTLPKARER